MNPALRRRSEDCLSDYELDALVLVENGTDSSLARGRENATSHLAACGGCRQRHEELREFAMEFANEAPSLRNLEERSRRPPGGALASRRMRLWAGVSGAVALAAAAALFVRTSARDAATITTNEEAIRLKGGTSIGFFVEHRGQVRYGGDGERVAPGDRLQFVYTSNTDAFVYLLSKDGRNAVASYFETPADSPLPGTRERGEQPLPTAVTLDDVLGAEAVWGLVCDRSHDSRGLLARMAEDSFVAPNGCEVTRFEIEKTLGSTERE